MFSDARRGDDPRDRNAEPRDRSDASRGDDARTLGRGPGDNARATQGNKQNRDRWENVRRLERDRDPRERSLDPGDVFMKDLNLPRGRERQIVRDRGHEYTLRGSETRTLSTVGAFRVVPARDLRDHDGRSSTLSACSTSHARTRMSSCRAMSGCPDSKIGSLPPSSDALFDRVGWTACHEERLVVGALDCCTGPTLANFSLVDTPPLDPCGSDVPRLGFPVPA